MMAAATGDHQPLLINEESASVENHNGVTAVDEGANDNLPIPAVSGIIVPRRTVIIEPVMFLFCLASISNDTLFEQYIHSRLTRLYPILQNVTGDGNTSKCEGTNASDPLLVEEARVTAGTAVWLSYLALPSLITVVTTILYGAYSDISGRRQILLLPSIFGAIKFTINSFVIYYKLPLYVLLVSGFVEPFGGGFYTLLLGVYAYLADTASPDKLGIRMTIVDGIMNLGIGLSQIGLGYSIKSFGYFYTYMILAGFLFLNLIYVIFFVPETIIQDKNKQFKVGEYVRATWLSFSNREDKRHIKTCLLVMAFFVFSLTYQSLLGVQILFVMGPPLCWGAVSIGIFVGGTTVLVQTCSILGYEVFTRCKIPEIGIAAIGIVSVLVGCLVNAFADSIYWMIIVSLTCLFCVLPLPMLRTCASKMFKEDEQGRVSSAFSAVGAFSYMVSSLMMNTIYQRTSNLMPGFVFIVAAGFCLLSLLVIGWYVVFTRKSSKRKHR